MNHDRWWIRQRRWAPYLFLAPFMALFCIFMLYPLSQSFLLSFFKTAGPRNSVFVGLGNYRYLLGHDLLFGLAVANTAGYTLCFLLLQVPLSLGLAIFVNSKRIKFRNAFRFAFFSTYLVGHVFVAVVFFQIFSPAGLLNKLISLVFNRPVTVPWLTSPWLAMPSVLIAGLWLSIGYGMIYFLAGLQAVDPELYEAAAIDGAHHWQSFLHVTLPGIRPVLAYVILIGAITGFQLFELPYVLLQGAGPSGRGLTIVMYLFNMGFGAGDLGYASAIGWTLVLILFVISVAHLKLLRTSSEHA
jgi:ABC-type sugar transport system permease subunit